MTEEQHSSQDMDPQEETGATSFDRGSSLSIFHTDRAEDWLALVFALGIAAGVYFLVS